ncbi:MAG: hypothetical protein AB7G28_22405 [Pirellulales bacterium]
MSVDQLPPGKARPAKRDAQFVRYDEYIDKQIDSTRRSVKAVDLLTALLTMAVGTMSFLLAAAMIEHWLVPGGFNVAVRLILFVALAVCLTFYTTRRLWPLVRGSINPAYAAQAIEQENPSLKNSLLNLLLFRQHRDDVTDAVYETLEAEAATRLHRVPIDSAVDRTQLLRLGYALIFILAVVALYKILSPKDPFASAERVLMPWARIAAPSRVSIENIEPGHVTLSRGDTLAVAADVRGIGDDDPVVVRFTTADGQAVDRPAAMKPDAAGLRFKGQIPPEGDAALGVAQDLRYHIEAGDARSLEYKVTVISAPLITIERIDYDYPDYTGYADRSIDRLGDIRAIEGTRVTIHARANQSIHEAAIDFESDGRRDVQLKPQGELAQATFTLDLRDDRQRAKFTSYAIRFTGVDGRSNRNPVKYPIEVVPDAQPEAAILAPKEKTRDVRLDERVEISVEARDPDFALSGVRVEGESAGRKVIDERLLGREHNGRFTGRLLFKPSEHELHSGDVVRYWVVAQDNRTPKANETATDSQTLRIVGPDQQKPPQDRLAQRNERDQQQSKDEQNQQEQQGQQRDQQQNQDQSGEGEQGQSGGQSSDSSQGGQQGENEQSGESSSSEGESGESGGQGEANQSSENGSGEKSQNQQPGEQQSGEQQPGSESNGGGQSSESEQGGESGQAEQRPGGKPQSGEGGQPGQQSSPQQGSQEGSQQPSQGSEPNGESNGAQSSTPQSGEQSAGRENQPGDGSQGAAQPQQQPGSQGQSEGAKDSSPVSSEGENDGEAFERIQEFLTKEGQLPKDSSEQNANEQSSGEKGAEQQPGQSTSEKSETGQQESADGQTGEQQSGEQQSGTQKSGDERGESGDQQGDAERPNDSSSQKSERDSETANGDSQAQSEGESPGANTQSGGQQSKTEEPSSDGKKQQPDGGQQTNSQGESGAGNQPEQGQGAPESQDLKPTEKWQQRPSGDKQSEQQEAPSGGHGKRESDSQGDQGGDHAGDGEEGGGQKSNRDGTGSSGQNQSADEGAGESSEQGSGRNSSSGGQDAQANERTGESSQGMQGKGSEQRDGEGNKSGGERGNQQGQSPRGEQGEKQEGSADNAGEQQGKQGQDGQQGQQQKPSSDREQQGGNNSQRGGENESSPDARDAQSKEAQGAQRSGSNAADGAGRVPDAPIQPGSSTGEAPGADAANLDYARKRTDLVLETLAEQMKRQKVDKRLLDKLGWTEADMKRFVERWQQLKAAADANGPDANEAQRELDDALRSLGLRHGQLQQVKVTDDQNRNLRQGYRGAVPLEYQERLRAYNQGVSRARQEDD